MTDYRQGDVYLASVLSTGDGTPKQRPVVVVGNELVIDIDVLMAPVTSSAARNDFDVVLEHWRDAGLLKPSVARTSKISAIPKRAITQKLGHLHESDLQKVLENCRRLF